MKSKAKSAEDSKNKWKDKYMDAKEECKTKDAELKKKLRSSQDTTEALSDLLLRQLKDNPSGRKL